MPRATTVLKNRSIQPPYPTSTSGASELTSAATASIGSVKDTNRRAGRTGRTVFCS